MSNMSGFRLAFQRCAQCPLPPLEDTRELYHNSLANGGPLPLGGTYLAIPPLNPRQPRIDLDRLWLRRDLEWERTLL